MKGSMSVEERRAMPVAPLKGVWVCVDRCGNYDLAGRIYSGPGGQRTEFENVADLLLKIDTILDARKSPQAFQKKRSFQKKKKEAGSGKTEERSPGEANQELDFQTVLRQRGDYGTFNIDIESRMHTSWQGFVKDETGRLIGVFESELGLIDILVRRGRQLAVLTDQSAR